MPAVSRDRLHEISGLVTRARPGRPPKTVTLAGEGLDNVAYDVDAELIVRLHKQPDPALLETAARTLQLAASCSPPAVPQPLLADPAGALVYPRLLGVPLLDLREDTGASISTASAPRSGASSHACTASRPRATRRSRRAIPRIWARG
jgi:hypothetical protein